jgi:hypothetical protein
LEETEGLLPIVRTLSDRHVVLLAKDGSIDWMLMDMSGRVVMQGTSSGAVEIPNYGLPAGIYALRMMQGGEGATVRLFVSGR